jgi:hypothetical protein
MRIPQLLIRARVTLPRLWRLALRAPESREANCGAEFKKFDLLMMCNGE